MLRSDRLDPDRAQLLVIDLQEKLLPLIPDHASILGASARLLAGARIFELPIVATEQYTKGLGLTDQGIRDGLTSLGATIIEKATFSACGIDPVRDAFRRIDRPQVIIAGIECHICVMQTALDLVAMDFDTFVCADAVGSRQEYDKEVALSRLRHAGATVCTVESALFELCERCDTARFKQMLEIIKS